MTDKIQLIKDVIKGEKVAKIPYSFWSHFPGVDLDAEKLAQTTYSFYKDLDLDLIKTMPNGMFSIQDFGCECDFSAIASGGVAKVTRLAVNTPEDWKKLDLLDVETGSMGRELNSLRLLLGMVNNEVPVIATVFSPLTTAYKLSGGKVLDHLASDPKAVLPGLAAITETTCRFAQKAIDLGCAGIFLANQLCTREMMTVDGFNTYCRPYDLEVLKSIESASWFNVLHIHGNQIRFDQVRDYPTHGFSYHVWETRPEIHEFLRHTQAKVLMGGIQRSNISQCRPIALMEELKQVWNVTGGRNLILAPGCTIRHPLEKWMLKALVASIREFEEMQSALPLGA